MKKSKRDRIVYYQRPIILAIIFLIQIIWLFFIFTNIISYSAVLQVVLTLFSFVMTLYLITKDEAPAYKFSWIVVISLLPVLGGLLYLMIGNKRPTRSMQRAIIKQKEIHANEMIDIPDARPMLAEKNSRLENLAYYVQKASDSPVYTDTDVKYYANGESMMPDLLEDLKQADRTIFIEFFIVEYGEMFDAIFDILIEKAAAGVEVRFIYDDFGSITRLPNDFDKKCEDYGIQALKFNPVKPIVSMVYNTRDHRKFVIIDGEVAYTGGLNLADEYINRKERFGYWKDTMIRVEGPAVWNYTRLFLDMWNAFKETDHTYSPYKPHDYLFQMEQHLKDGTNHIEYKGFVQPFGDSPLDLEALGENVYRDILNTATDYVYIFTPYLVISYEMQTALQLAARRGVDVRLMTPGIPDKKIVYRITRSFYRPLLEAGVKIYEFEPGFLHAKSFVSDDRIAVVGTINLDYRSLYLHFETATIMYYHQVIKDICNDFLNTQKESRQVTIDDTRMGLFGHLWDSILRLLAPFV